MADGSEERISSLRRAGQQCRTKSELEIGHGSLYSLSDPSNSWEAHNRLIFAAPMFVVEKHHLQYEDGELQLLLPFRKIHLEMPWMKLIRQL